MLISNQARLSQFWLPTRRDNPAEAVIASHRLMLRSGMIRQSIAGVYVWLPLGLRVLHKIADHVRAEMLNAGSGEILMPTIQPAELWKQSGRYDGYGPEMLRLKDRHGRDLLYGPTNEEVITQVIGEQITSYRQLPLSMYHIQWKFRDEIRPRFGVLRGREFLMKDAYSFDIDEEQGMHSYRKMFLAYLRVFDNMGLKAIPMLADTGPIGGDNSHEFIVLAESGESKVFCDKAILELDPKAPAYNYSGNLEGLVEEWSEPYAVTEEKFDQAAFDKRVPKARQIATRGIEIGQTFFFADKYSKPLGAKISDANGKERNLMMGSYGIGISRLVGAIAESGFDDRGIKWPKAVAPFAVGIIELDKIDLVEDCTTAVSKLGLDWLLDDRNERPGTKFADMDLVGAPLQIIVGARAAKENKVEVKLRSSGEKELVPINKLAEHLKEAYQNVA